MRIIHDCCLCEWLLTTVLVLERKIGTYELTSFEKLHFLHSFPKCSSAVVRSMILNGIKEQKSNCSLRIHSKIVSVTYFCPLDKLPISSLLVDIKSNIVHKNDCTVFLRSFYTLMWIIWQIFCFFDRILFLLEKIFLHYLQTRHKIDTFHVWHWARSTHCSFSILLVRQVQPSYESDQNNVTI